MFYNNGRKVIPWNISEYLTPLVLAFWIMDDGGFSNYGIRLSINRFKLKEVELLQDVIKSKYKLETTIKKYIYIYKRPIFYILYIHKTKQHNKKIC